jgi:hypothetical protein
LVTTNWSHYDGNFGSVVSYPQLSKEEIEELLCVAIRECSKTPFKTESMLHKLKNDITHFGTLATIKHCALYIAKKLHFSFRE